MKKPYHSKFESKDHRQRGERYLPWMPYHFSLPVFQNISGLAFQRFANRFQS